jgi:hypothetical protein
MRPVQGRVPSRSLYTRSLYIDIPTTATVGQRVYLYLPFCS